MHKQRCILSIDGTEVCESGFHSIQQPVQCKERVATLLSDVHCEESTKCVVQADVDEVGTTDNLPPRPLLRRRVSSYGNEMTAKHPCQISRACHTRTEPVHTGSLFTNPGRAGLRGGPPLLGPPPLPSLLPARVGGASASGLFAGCFPLLNGTPSELLSELESD